jgi:hypothetical protein
MSCKIFYLFKWKISLDLVTCQTIETEQNKISLTQHRNFHRVIRDLCSYILLCSAKTGRFTLITKQKKNV